ncbi:uncharacterized protein LOC121055516 [Oryza brachyantha]|uniref:uncharacterized protein LOC121055516 n=1 Tax=Oryza brachyantha TaxID=4533 RepID=UPI001ADD365B|nr:uncharacterized protein LOC121055516 [Oryza brachyantha]
MATAWVRSLSCRSYGVADAVVAPSPSKKAQSPPTPMLPAVSCAAAEDVRDSVAFLRHGAAKKARRERRRAPEERPRREVGPRPKKKPKQVTAGAFMPSPAAAAAAPVSSAFLTMAELPVGHSSRRVVELIFSSGWGVSSAAPEPAVEAMFRVHSAARAVARFEEARAAARAHGAAARCGADGNEMMRFQCRAAAGPGGVFGAGVATCRLGATDTAVRTFAGSGAAHSSAGAGPGRRAMLVCRVIAGRVRPAHDHSRHHASDYDSVDMGNGELVVLDSRAVLPCFLIIYKV